MNIRYRKAPYSVHQRIRQQSDKYYAIQSLNDRITYVVSEKDNSIAIIEGGQAVELSELVLEELCGIYPDIKDRNRMGVKMKGAEQ